MILSESDVRYYLSLSGFKGSDLTTAVKICYCESGFNTDAWNKTSIEDSRGLMQVNVIAHPEYSSLDLFDPRINTNIAYRIFRSEGFNAWKNCKNKIPETIPDPIILFALIGAIALYYTL